MNIRLFRLLSFALLARIIFTQHYVYITYWFVLVASTGFLHSRRLYNGKINSSLLFFFLYLLFVTLWRTGDFEFDTPALYAINIIEHFLFAVTTCFLLNLFLGLNKMFRGFDLRVKLLLIWSLFNALGLLNEVYQNMAQSRALLAFSADSLKDILVNFSASTVFAVIMYYFPVRALLQK